MAGGCGFSVQETTIEAIHTAYRAKTLTVRQLVQTYLDRIERLDKRGPSVNAVITLNSAVLQEADNLDSAFAASGFVGPLHGIPIMVKDQVDIKGMPTTLGSVLFKDYVPDRDAFIIGRLREAGAVFLGKATLGELGGGDTHGSLFGSTRNVYNLDRTAGGSSGGSAVCVSANFCTVSVAQEGFSSIRRPAAWNGIVGMRPSIGLVSRTGVYGGWPTLNGSLGPMARTVADLVRLLDSMIGFDPSDPITAKGLGRFPAGLHNSLDRSALKGARLGVLREPVGYATDAGSDDFRKVGEAFERSVGELRVVGAEIIDDIVIPDLKALLATRSRDAAADEAMFQNYFAGPNAPFATRQDVVNSPWFANVNVTSQRRFQTNDSSEQHYRYLKARDTLMINVLKVMADHRLDAIVHKAVEHQPTRIEAGIAPPYVDQTGALHINTFLMSVPSIVVPSGFTKDGLPTGITFLGRPYDDARVIQLAYSYEQLTNHRCPPPLLA